MCVIVLTRSSVIFHFTHSACFVFKWYSLTHHHIKIHTNRWKRVDVVVSCMGKWKEMKGKENLYEESGRRRPYYGNVKETISTVLHV
jgi:hypothetical protein